MPVGILRRYSDSGGYGFIQRDDGSADVFVHISKLRLVDIEYPRVGMKLSFDIIKHRNGAKTQAANIQLIDD